jgi:response regulator RpfG family c-di-GMP phosphodiesterase/serine/threonine protein kinase
MRLVIQDENDTAAPWEQSCRTAELSAQRRGLMSTLSKDNGAAALLSPASTGPAQPTMAERPPSTGYHYSPERVRRTSGPGSSPKSATTGSDVVTATEFLDRILDSRLLSAEELDQFLAGQPALVEGDTRSLMEAFVGQGLLTEYQVTRLLSGQTFGLVLGNYRMVERLGAGGMGVVYKAEHIHMKRSVAIKVLVTKEDRNSVFLQRFYSEMQATAVLSHPNIVLAFDAGEIVVPNSPDEILRYLVMEYVPGKNLEQYVLDNGSLPIAEACEYIRQAASGLQHAFERGLVHRDIKPSNLILTPQKQVKILDFGLARLCRRRHTEAHTMLGSVDYMAPEQARDARSVDIRADIYGLGGTLYWLLTGHKPFPGDRPIIEELLARQKETPQPLEQARSDIPPELQSLVQQMMALEPSGRYPTPTAVMTALNAFLEQKSPTTLPVSLTLGAEAAQAAEYGNLADPSTDDLPAGHRGRRALVLSPSAKIRVMCRTTLEAHGLECSEACDDGEARAKLAQNPHDLLLVDAQLPDGTALQICTQIRAEPPAPHFKLILLTPRNTAEWIGLGQKANVDDCLPRSVSARELANRIRAVLRIKESEERSDYLASQLLRTSQQLEQALRLRDCNLYQAQDVLIFAMAKMAELRGLETGSHLLRLQGYVRVLAEEAMRLPAFAGLIDDAFVRMLERCVLLHDIGKVAIPDNVLLKPGRFDAEERCVMESHTTVGAEILLAVARQHGASLGFLQMAIDVARHHHERWDGTGYPNGLAGDAIPLSARIVTIADVYDALRSKLVYKPGLTHSQAKRLILDSNPGQFDPALLIAFRNSEATLDRIFLQTKD